MVRPAAPTEAGGDKISYLIYNLTGTNMAALYRAVEPVTVNAEVYGYLGVATHGDGRAFVTNDPVVLGAGVEEGGTTVRKILTDATGRTVMRPIGTYDAGAGSMGYGHLGMVARTTVNAQQVGALSVGTHQDGVAGWTAPQPVVVTGGYDGTNVRKQLSDAAGRTRTWEDYTLSGNGVTAISAGAATQLRANTPCRRVFIRPHPTNSGPVFVGVAGVTPDDTAATGGLQVPANGAVDFAVSNTNQIYVNSVLAAKVSYVWFT